ncbi:ATPase [Azospirillum palustre]
MWAKLQAWCGVGYAAEQIKKLGGLLLEMQSEDYLQRQHLT